MTDLTFLQSFTFYVAIVSLAVSTGALVSIAITIGSVVTQIERTADELMGIHSAVIAEQIRRDEREKRYET
jgi:hypothetical protein